MLRELGRKIMNNKAPIFHVRDLTKIFYSTRGNTVTETLALDKSRPAGSPRNPEPDPRSRRSQALVDGRRKGTAEDEDEPA